MLWRLLVRAFRNDFKLNRCSQRETGNAINQAARVLVFPEDALQQFGSSVSYLRLIADVSRSGDRYAEPDNPTYFVE